MTDTESIVDSIVSDFEDADADSVRERVENLASYGVPADEIKRNIRSDLSDTHGAPTSSNEEVTLEWVNDYGPNDASIDQDDVDDEWIDLAGAVEVLQIMEERDSGVWEKSSDARTGNVDQKVLVGDETQTAFLTTFETSLEQEDGEANIPEFEKGETYALENVTTDWFNGNTNLKANSGSSIEAVDADVDTTNAEREEMEGVLVDIAESSGLIERCPEDDCSRVLQNGNCNEHGKVAAEDRENDLRIKANLDGTHETQTIIANRELTAEILGYGLSQAIEVAKDEMDRGAIRDQLVDQFLGKTLRVEGADMGDNLVLDEFEVVTTAPSLERTDDLLVDMRAQA